MKVNELRSVVAKLVPEYLVDNTVHKISHWISKIYYDGEYAAGNEKEIKMLNKLYEIGLLKTDDAKAVFSLTDKGMKLFRNFEANGFYGSVKVKRFFEIRDKNKDA